ncbi:MAG: hypothetical protein WEB52_14040 [Dehalococcoidia bacterium]
MKLSREEHQRGVLYWDPPIEGVSFFTGTSDSPGDQEAPLAGPLNDAQGSKVLSPPHQYTKLALQLADPTAVDRIENIRWERENVTQVWTEGLAAPPTKLVFVPDLGVFHRRVIAVPYLDWSEDTVIRLDGTLVRFVTGEMRGEQVTPFDQVSAEGAKWVIEGGGMEAASAEGRFIEVVARGETEREAQLLVQSVLGLIALAMGDHAAGEVVFAEDYQASREQQQGKVYVPVKTLVPRAAGHDEIDTIDALLPFILESSRASRARALSLRWYEKGIRSATPTDKLFSFFIGVEAIVNYWASTNSPIPVVQERLARFEAAMELAATLGDEVKQAVRQRLIDSTLTERVQFYAESHKLDTAFVDDFRVTTQLRNSAVHGDLAAVDETAASRCKRVLSAIIRCEFGVAEEFEWEQHGTIFGASLTYTLDAAGVMRYGEAAERTD